jgi:CheY-like chemotaxis protein
MDSDSKTILLVEDDRNDVFFLQFAFEEARVVNPLQVVTDGQQAVDYLAGRGAYADRGRFPFPGLVLLDLKLPVRMGLDVLRWIRQQAELQTLLVVVLTSSCEPCDIAEAYRLGARSYLIKPITVADRLVLAKAIKRYWIDLNRSPEPGNLPQLRNSTALALLKGFSA